MIVTRIRGATGIIFDARRAGAARGFSKRTAVAPSIFVINEIRSTSAIDAATDANANDFTANAATYALAGLIPGLTAAVSRKTHGAAGTFDIDLPLAGTQGVECRTGGATCDHQIVFTFANEGINISGNPQATVTGGSGSITGVTISGNTVTVNLTGVLNAQTTSVTLNNVSYGVGTGNITVSMGALLGDTNGDRVVNAGDSTQTRSRSGSLTDGATFRSDVNLDGVVNSGDTSIVRGTAGTGLSTFQPGSEKPK